MRRDTKEASRRRLAEIYVAKIKYLEHQLELVKNQMLRMTGITYEPDSKKGEDSDKHVP